MAVNRGKQFEGQVKQAFEACPYISIDRFYDPAAGFKGIKTFADFCAYSYPHQFYFECKSISGNTLNFKSDITQNQWEGLELKSRIPGVIACVMVWFTSWDVIIAVPIQEMLALRKQGAASLNWKAIMDGSQDLWFTHFPGQKKNVLFYHSQQDVKDVLCELIKYERKNRKWQSQN